MKAQIATNGISIVKSEIHNVVSQMRLNARFSSGARFHREIVNESPLVNGFKMLHDALVAETEDLCELDTVDWLRPFLDVIAAPETSGPITGAALSSLSKFLLYGLIRPNSVRVADAVNLVSHIVCRCRFEQTDVHGDEVVMMRILQALLDLIRCSAGHLLTDISIWEIYMATFGISRQHRLGVLLRRTAENVMMQITMAVFARLEELNNDANSETAEVSYSPSLPKPSFSSQSSSSHFLGDMSQFGDSDIGSPEPGNASWNGGLPTIRSAPPYGISCMQHVLKMLCQLTNPSDGGSEDRRMLGLSLVNVVLETSGCVLSSCPALVKVIQDDLCKFLLQNSRTSNVQILSLTLRVVFNMFTCVRQHMKVQLEVFFNSIHLSLADSEASTLEVKEMSLESLVEFCREPQLMVDIYTNYDCDVQCTNLFENLCKFLSKMTFPLTSSSLNALNLLALEGLLAILHSLATDCCSRSIDDSMVSEELATNSEAFREAKAQKKKLYHAAEQFNKKPSKGLEYLQSVGMLPEVLDPQCVSQFLRTAPALDRTVVGDYLGERNDFNIAVMKAFVESFDFSNLSFDDSIRLLLSGFRLPGEAQKIERIMEQFAAHFYQQQKEQVLVNSDAAFILAFSVIMLNTDLHNKTVKKKMTLEEFVRNTRGINDNGDIPREYLANIYHSISHNEIKMKDDLVTGGSSAEKANMAWETVLEDRQNQLGGVFSRSNRAAHGRDMFHVIWDSTMSALSVVFETTEDARVLQKTLDGWENFAMICAQYGMDDTFNKQIVSMCKSVKKFAENSSEIRSSAAEEDRRWDLARNKKLQNAAKTVFGIGRQHMNLLREAWRNLLDFVFDLYNLHLLPNALCELEEFSDVRGHRMAAMSHADVPRNARKSGLMGLVAYFWGSRSESNESDDIDDNGWRGSEEETILNEFVFELHLDDMFATIISESRSLEHLITGLVLAANTCYQDNPKQTMFCLELLTNQCIANGNRAELCWPIVFPHLEQLMESFTKPCALLDRVVVNTLRLAVRLTEFPIMSTNVMDLLHLILQLEPPLQSSVGDRVALGILTLIKTNGDKISTREMWMAVLTLLNQLAPHRTAHHLAVDSLSLLCTDPAINGVQFCNFDILLTSIRIFVDMVHDTPPAKFHLPPNTTGLSLAESVKIRSRRGGYLLHLMLAVFLRLGASSSTTTTSTTTTSSSSSTSTTTTSTTPPNATTSSESSNGTEVKSSNTSEQQQQNNNVNPSPVDQSPYPNSDASSDKETPRHQPQVASHPSLVELPEEQWCKLWLMVLSAFCKVMSEKKHVLLVPAGLQCLERALLSGEVIVMQPQALKTGFEQILFPMLVLRFSAKEEDVVQLRAFTLVCKALLHNIANLSTMKDFGLFWVKFVGTVAECRRYAASQQVAEAILENLRNLIMVMNSDGIFAKTTERTGQDTLELTWTILDSFCPEDFKKTLFPERYAPVVEPIAVEMVMEGSGMVVASIPDAQSPANSETAAATTTSSSSTNQENEHMQLSDQSNNNNNDSNVASDSSKATSADTPKPEGWGSWLFGR